MFWLGLLLIICFAVGYTGASIPTQWVLLSLFLPLSLWRGTVTSGHKLFFILLVWGAVSFYWSDSGYSWVFGMWIASIWTLSYHYGTLVDDLSPLWRGLAVGLYVSTAVAVAQTLGYAPVEAASTAPFYSPGLLFNPALTTNVCGIVIVALICHRLWWYIPGPALGLILCGSRGGFAVIVMGLAARFGGWLGALAAFVTALGLFALTTNPSDFERMQIWAVSLGSFDPLGHGPGSFADIFYVRENNIRLIRPGYAHNDLIQLIYEFGPAAFAVAAVFVTALRQTANVEWPTLFALVVLSGFFFPFYTPILSFVGLVMAGSMLRHWGLVWDLRAGRGSIILSRRDSQEPIVDLNRSEALPMVKGTSRQEA